MIVKTRKPLDMAASTGFAGVKFGNGTVSTGLGKESSALYSWKDEQKPFGVLMAGAMAQGGFMRRGIEADGRWSEDVTPGTFLQERKRTALNVRLQARPITGIDQVNYTNLTYGTNALSTAHHLFTGADPAACTQRDPDTGIRPKSTTTATNETGAFLQPWVRTAEMSSDSLVLDGSIQGGRFQTERRSGQHRGGGVTALSANYGYCGANLPKWAGSRPTPPPGISRSRRPRT